MCPQVHIVTGDQTLPDRADLVVIGGGIIGCSAALWAAEQGHRVVLLEKGRIAGEQSGRNWGWVRRMGRARAEYPIGIESLKIWDGLNTRIGRDTGFRRSGIVYSGSTPAELAWLETIEQDALDFGISIHRLGRTDLAGLFPGAPMDAGTALLTEDDGRAEPALAAPAIALGARDAGAALMTGCAARSLETSTGRVSAVITEQGPIATSAVILAGGVWSRQFAGNLGFSLPQLRIRSSVLRTGPVPGGPPLALGNNAFGLRPRLDGGYTIAPRGRSPVQITPDAFRLLPLFLPGLRSNWREITLSCDRAFWQELTTPRCWADDAVSPFERCRVLDPEPQARSLAKAMRAVRFAFPAFQNAQVVERWGGIIDATPDGVPIIDEAPGLPGLIIATGFSGHGFGIGPAAGQMAGELATGMPTIVDPQPFRLSRFQCTGQHNRRLAGQGPD